MKWIVAPVTFVDEHGFFIRARDNTVSIVCAPLIEAAKIDLFRCGTDEELVAFFKEHSGEYSLGFSDNERVCDEIADFFTNANDIKRKRGQEK